LHEYRRRAAGNGAAVATATGSLKVVEAADAGDPIARSALADAASGWAMCVAIVYGILDPTVVLLGGGMSEDLAPHLGLVRSQAARLMVKPPRIELAALGPRAGLVGAASCAARADD
jgi:glucokinase